MLQQLEHSQSPTSIILNDSTTEYFMKNNITQKRSKSWDMKYYWLRDKHIQRNFDYIWKKSQLNLADYHTKHFPAVYHRRIRKKIVLDFPQ